MASGKLGEGTYGQVIAKDGKARKIYRYLEDLIQELIVGIYMNDSPFTVNVLEYSFDSLFMDMDLWKMNLRYAIDRFHFEDAEKMKIFHDLLKGICQLHARGITHCDFKPSNILVQKGAEVKVCIADMGLSSIHKYAKSDLTSPAYRSAMDAPADSGKHDSFGFAMTIAELFGNRSLERKMSPRMLRNEIDKIITPKYPEVGKMLKLLCPDNPARAISPEKVLHHIFQETPDIELPKLLIPVTRISRKTDKWLEETTLRITSSSWIQRGYRCYMAIKWFLDNPKNKDIEKTEYVLYMGTMIMIFSAVFGEQGFTVNEVKALVASSKYTKTYSTRDIYKCLYRIFEDIDLLRFIMLPSA